MTFFEGLVVFILIWWLVFFTVLPFGLRQEEHDPESGHSPGAPATPDFKRKAIITTSVSVVIWIIIYFLVKADIVSFHDIARQMMTEDQLK